MNSVTYGEGYRGDCKKLKSGPLRSNLVRSARAAYVTFYKLESEYPLTVLATPPLQNDSKPCLHYLATCQLLPHASASAPPSMLLRIRKAFCSRLAERPKNVCAALQHTQQTIIRRKYSGTLFQDALDGGGRVHSRSAPLKPCSQDLNIMNEFQSRISCRNEFCF